MTIWDERYGEGGWAFGTEPNDFLREVAARLPVGRTLCLAEGEGRNAVFLASLGHKVTAVDQSTVGLGKTRGLAAARGVDVRTLHADLEGWPIEPGAWDAIVAIFAHLPPAGRRRMHAGVAAGLAPGGAFVAEYYTPRQAGRGTGGPGDPDRLVTAGDLRAELAGLRWDPLLERDREVIEGRYHTGLASVVQGIGWR